MSSSFYHFHAAKILERHCLFGKDLLCRDMLYLSVGVLHDDTLVMQGFFLQHTFLGQSQALVYFILQFKYFLF